MCSPNWDRGNKDLEDVFLPEGDNINASPTEFTALIDYVKPNQFNKSNRDSAQPNDSECTEEFGIQHLPNTLSSQKIAEEQVNVVAQEASSCPLEGTSLQDFEVIGSCEEAKENGGSMTSTAVETIVHPSHSYVRTGVRPSLPSPDVLGGGNPFLIFLCLTVLLQHRDSIISRHLDANEIAMHFDRLVRKHSVERVLGQARTLYYRYLGHFNSQNS